MRPETVLQRAHDLWVRLHGHSEVWIETRGGRQRFDMRALAALEAFAQPIAFRDGLEALRVRARSPQEFMETSAQVLRLADCGVLTEATEQHAAFGQTGFGRLDAHKHMLGDRRRVSQYLRAIRQVVTPGDVVVEIGTGTGILSIAAAQAGARRVYAIEAGPVADVAEAMFRANGVDDRVTLLRGWSTDVSLPERADVLVSEILGHGPFGEGVIEFTADAVRRMLKPGARLIPDRVRAYALPVSVTPSLLGRRRVSQKTAAQWQAWYGIDFSAVARARRPAVSTRLASPREIRRWTPLAPPVLLADIALGTVTTPVVDVTATATASRRGRVSGVAMYFEADLAPSVVLSTSPAEVDPDNSWSNPVWIFDDPLPVHDGTRFTVRLQERTASPGMTIAPAATVSSP